MDEWTADEVIVMLTKSQFQVGKFEAAFRKADITGAKLASITVTSLRNAAVKGKHFRPKLLKKIQELLKYLKTENTDLSHNNFAKVWNAKHRHEHEVWNAKHFSFARMAKDLSHHSTNQATTQH